MALQHHVTLKGKIGPVINYEVNGKFYSRSIPKKVRQTDATKGKAKLFGIASGLSRAIRSGLAGALPDANTNILRNRFIKPVYRWVCAETIGTQEFELGLLTQFEFNEKTSIRARFRRLPGIKWEHDHIILNFVPLNPKHHIIAPAWTTKVHVEIAATVVTTGDTPQPIAQHTVSYIIDYNAALEDERIINIPFGVKNGQLGIIMMALKYEVKNKILDDKQWLPAGIIGTCFIDPQEETSKDLNADNL